MVGALFCCALAIVFIVGVVSTAGSVRNRSYYQAQTCPTDSPLSTRDCVHLVPVVVVSTKVYTTRVGKQLDVQLRGVQDGAFRPEVVLNSHANWSAIRDLPARYFNGAVRELQVPDKPRVATEDAPRVALPRGILLMAIPVAPLLIMALLYLAVRLGLIGRSGSRPRDRGRPPDHTPSIDARVAAALREADLPPENDPRIAAAIRDLARLRKEAADQAESSDDRGTS